MMERLIDLAADQSGLDRIALRRRNLVPESAMPYRNPFGLLYDSGKYHEVMETALRHGARTAFRLAGRRRRRVANVAASVSRTTSIPRPACRVSELKSPSNREGMVEVVIGTGSQGQGHENELRPVGAMSGWACRMGV